MDKVIPTVFARDKESFNERLKVVSAIAKAVQIDFMDGKFVKTKSIGIEDIRVLQTGRKYEAHLMCFNPFGYFSKLKKKGFSKVIFHYEAVKEVQEVIDFAQDDKLEPWIAFNPATNLDKIESVLSKVLGLKGVLFLGHKPGVEGIGFDKRVLTKIKAVRKAFKGMKIQVDGGVNGENAGMLRKAGVDFVNVGSSVANSFNPQNSLREIEKAFC